MSHALETLTDISYARRARPQRPSMRPPSQGANPFSDMVAFEALKLVGKYLARAVNDASDTEARAEMMYAATLAGIAFGNAGCHLPHAMSYAVSGLVREYRTPHYPQDEPFVPHGMSVVLNAPSVYRYTAAACADRHLDAAQRLGADTRGAAPEDAGEVLQPQPRRELVRIEESLPVRVHVPAGSHERSRHALEDGDDGRGCWTLARPAGWLTRIGMMTANPSHRSPAIEEGDFA